MINDTMSFFETLDLVLSLINAGITLVGAIRIYLKDNEPIFLKAPFSKALNTR